MNYRPVFVSSENQLNKILKKQKKSRENMAVLFLSLWDEASTTLAFDMEEPFNFDRQKGDRDHLPPVYIVNSFDMPHTFVIYKTTKIPHLVQFKRGKTVSEDYLPMVYQELGL